MTSVHVVVVTGLRFEARIADGSGVRVLCRQGPGLAALLETGIDETCRGMVSFGTAGGLVDALRPGDWVVGRTLVGDARRFTCDAAWSDALLRALPAAHHVDVAGVAAPVAGTEAKRALHAATGAAAVDMESQIVARIAHARAIPFVCCRVVIDPVGRSLPAAALAGMRHDGSTDLFAVLRSLLGQPGQLPELLAVARDARTAQRALAQGRRRIGDEFGRPN